MTLLAGAEAIPGLFLGVFGIAAVTVILGGCIYITKLIVDGFRRSHAAKLEATARENQDRLKSLMIQRGMSADEIERVLNTEGARADFGSATAVDPETRIVEALTTHHYSADDIARVLNASRDEQGNIPPPTAGLVETLAANWADAPDIERVLRSRGKPATT